MTMQTTSLSELQSWFLTVMTATGGAQQGVALARQRFGLDAMQVVAQSSDAAALRRMHIYAEGYVLRLLECLQADYPVLHKVMGDALFGFFARAYIARHPSTSPTLYDLGAGFAEFLRGSQREAAPEMRGLLLLPVELARLERARTEVTRARGLEQQPRRFTHSPFDLMMGVPLQISTPPCLRLLQLDLPLLGFWEGISRGGEVPAAPELAHNYVAITRMHYRVNLLNLEPWQYHYLVALSEQADSESNEAGSQQALAHAAKESGSSSEQILTQLMLWLPLAENLGLIAQ